MVCELFPLPFFYLIKTELLIIFNINAFFSLFSGPVRNSNTLSTDLMLSRFQRETTDGNGTTNAEDTCIFNDGQTVLKADVNCDKRPGCKTTQKPNECCPEYQCGIAIIRKKLNR